MFFLFFSFMLCIFICTKNHVLEKTSKENSVIIRFTFGLNHGLRFCSPYPPAGSEWKTQEERCNKLRDF